MAAPLKRCLAGIRGLLCQKVITRSSVVPRSPVTCSSQNATASTASKVFSTDIRSTTSVASSGIPFSCSSVPGTSRSLLQICSPFVNSLRTKIYCSKKGKSKTVKSVIHRFYRLDWGIWIRPKAGRKKHLWRKPIGRRLRAQQHVFCNKTQSKLLDKMVTPFWTKKRHYVDNPYEPYNKRTNLSSHYPERPRFLP